MTSQEIGKMLQDHDIKASYQRIRIFDYLIKNRTHPSVDTIYQALVDEIPTLSRTTVYNTLKLFTDKGIVNTLTIEENENRYDAVLNDHGHFKCKRCGQVFDFNLNDCKNKDMVLNGFDIHERHIYFRGICKQCQPNK